MKWIKVGDQLPQLGQKVLAIDMLDARPEVDFLRYFGKDQYGELDEWSSYSSNTFDPTHWMPLPEIPQCEHEWGSEECSESSNAHYVCKKCREKLK